MKCWKIRFITISTVEEYMPLKDVRIHTRSYPKIQQKGHLNNRIYNLLRCHEVRTSKQAHKMFWRSTEILYSNY